MKRFLSGILAVVMCMIFSIPTLAVEKIESNDCSASKLITSLQYPDAYIIEEVSYITKNKGTVLKEVSATVFVEETYALDNYGNPITISSRLLSENEVMAIGVENFEDINTAQLSSIGNLYQTRAATNSRGKLTITFSGEYYYDGAGVTANLTAHAAWSAGAGLFNGSTRPAAGSDFMGVAWSGEFSAPSASATASPTPPLLVMCASTPNAARVWEFEESWTENVIGNTVSFYLRNLNINITLHKNVLTGNGNTAEAVLKYIHTYSSTEGSISINASPNDVGAGFTLNNVSKQWEIVCNLTGIPY